MRVAGLFLAPALIATPVFAQDPHAHHQHQAPPAAPDPHAGHQMPKPTDPHAGHRMPATSDPHAGHAGRSTPPMVNAPAPPPPADHAADRLFDPAAMANARAQLKVEHGDIRWRKITVESAELRSGDETGYAWEADATFGGDINRFRLKTEGEGEADELHEIEVQALYSRAFDPYFNLELGVRQDIEPARRTYATAGVSGVAPYWFELGAAAFLSDRGELSARLEASYDLRLTQRLIMEPNLELSLTAEDAPELEVSAGLSELEAGLRLRYAITPTVAPYIGVLHERRFGDHEEDETRLVLGLRSWF